MRRLVIPLTLLLSSAAFAQTPPAPPQLSPQSAYEQATRPLEITRRSIENWSESETAALAVAVQQAKEQCSARTPSQYTGEDLIAYARLCALGQQWPSVQEAASLYLDATHRTGPGGQARRSVSRPPAGLRLPDRLQPAPERSHAALVTAREMLRTVPYTDLTSQVTNGTIRYIQLIQTPDALSLLSQRQTILLSLLRSAATPNPARHSSPFLSTPSTPMPSRSRLSNSSPTTPKPLPRPSPSLTPLFHLISQPTTPSSSPSHAANTPFSGPRRPASLPSSIFSTHLARSYRRIETNLGGATALLLFPDWCAQCIRMGSQFMPAFFRMGQFDVRFYALLAQATPPPTPAHAPAPEKAKSAASSKAKTFSLPQPHHPVPPIHLRLNLKPRLSSSSTLQPLSSPTTPSRDSL